MEGRNFCQTFATDLVHNLTEKDKESMLFMHYMSALSISKQLNENDKFYLITDTKGKELIKGYPYDDILTSLDDYPYVRPHKMSAYKLYSIEVFANKTFIHFDNDVYLFKPIEEFKDTYAQSDEKGFNKFLFEYRVKNYEWEFFDELINNETGYNPGVFGFTSDSIVRDEYYKTFLKYSAININKVNGMVGITKKQHLENMQDIYLFLEEVLLHLVCKKKGIEPGLILPDRYGMIEHPWGYHEDDKYIEGKWEEVTKIQFYDWLGKQYCHIMTQKNNTKLMEELNTYMYKLYPQDILNYLNK